MIAAPSARIAGAASLETDTQRSLYTVMRRISVFEDEVIKALKAGRLRSTFYPVRGLEPACAAIGEILRRDDYVVSTYRCLGDVVAKGVPLREIAAEMYGKVSGTSKGKGGAMHMADPHRGLMATTGVVGAGLPIATGLGLAAKMQASGKVTVTTFGDGATSIGACHESLNLAAIWQLPVVFVCQNNQWGEHTGLNSYTANPELTDRARAVGMRAVRVDGFEPLEVYQAVREAVHTARRDGLPTFIESITYRLRPHSFGTDTSYIPPGELEQALKRDPVPTFRARLLADQTLSAAELDDIDAKVDEEVTDAFADAERAEPTPADEMTRDVYGPATEGSQR
ncbi:thiamine pyrophosphate-dependent dehydrogenase E1 component subunit alpha [Mycolicibacterium sp. P9-22]|uniref:thiamine pyrophosphate-dependent dehydrogenase E1 component subunit alpha n=1 Tax=Mycolicibacterium sp. P9-22 TaxID=2024613 RepID=UPI0011EF9B75|nr:thiamine pyrophosphate-dependent dehydrogenase E1 component subunit alpha [Mycolicibacterium sp. P9-22]KAA0120622.1 thiamine pyrophosphate-dependent dehydrogenase E1 component subunit alpha [Mycolicibacterium sp. P9-22]